MITTIGKFFALSDRLDLPPEFADIVATIKDGFLRQTFTDFTDRDTAIAAYRRNDRKVRETFPADRPLVFNVADGWGPLCEFLGVPVPDEAFPHKNRRQEFWEHFGGEPAMVQGQHREAVQGFSKNLGQGA